MSYSVTQPSLIASFLFVNFPGTNISINDEDVDVLQNITFYHVCLLVNSFLFPRKGVLPF